MQYFAMLLLAPDVLIAIHASVPTTHEDMTGTSEVIGQWLRGMDTSSRFLIPHPPGDIWCQAIPNSNREPDTFAVFLGLDTSLWRG